MSGEMATQVLFWALAGLIALVYAGYPAILWVASLLIHRPVRTGEIVPFVTIMISAFNEEQDIGHTLDNKLAVDYPSEKLEIIVTSDDSTDGTDEVVRSFAGRGVRLIRQRPRQGKTAALNRMAQEAKGEILVFSDANSIYAKDAIKNLIRNFSDSAVGYVTGKMVYVGEEGAAPSDGSKAYMRYENFLRSLETRIGSVIGVDGGIDAVRKDLYTAMEPQMLPDFVLPLRVIQQGFRVVYEQEAILHEPALAHAQDEWRMRVRVSLRGFHALWTMRALFNPLRHGWVSFQLLFHKLLRYWVGFFQAGILALNVVLAPQSLLYGALLAGQLLFYLLALAGLHPALSGLLPAARHATYLCLLNAAAAVAQFKFFLRKNQAVWTPRKG